LADNTPEYLSILYLKLELFVWNVPLNSLFIHVTASSRP